MDQTNIQQRSIGLNDTNKNATYNSFCGPPLKRTKFSFTSSEMNDNSSMEYDTNENVTTDSQSMEYDNETTMTIHSQETVVEHYMTRFPGSTEQNIKSETSTSSTITRPIILQERNDRNHQTSLHHKRRLKNSDSSSSISSCSTNISQSSTLTERSLSEVYVDNVNNDDNNYDTNDNGDDNYRPVDTSNMLFDVQPRQQQLNETLDDNSPDDDDDDSIMMDALVSDWDRNFILHIPKYSTNRSLNIDDANNYSTLRRRTKEQVQQAKRSIHRRHFTTRKSLSIEV
jgi:hypothetical protein